MKMFGPLCINCWSSCFSTNRLVTVGCHCVLNYKFSLKQISQSNTVDRKYI